MTRRTIEELVERVDPMWPFIQQWIVSAPRPVTALPTDRERAEATLLALQVTTRSPLGAMAYETGGILVDAGWLRLPGSGAESMRDALLEWNGYGEYPVSDTLAGAFIIAHDVLGGFFAINLGAFGEGPWSVFYFAPDTLKWMDMEMSHADFLHWAITGDIDGFYAGQRWPNWEQDVAALDGDHGLLFWPMLWSSGVPLGDRSRRVVPQRELWSVQRDLARQIADLPPGSQIRVRFTDEDFKQED